MLKEVKVRKYKQEAQGKSIVWIYVKNLTD